MVVEGFERVSRGMEGAGMMDKTRNEQDGRGVRGVKRKFEIDEEEMGRNAREERAKARRELDEEKVSLVAHSCT